MTLPPVGALPTDTPDESMFSRSKMRKISRPSSSSPIVPTMATEIPCRARVTADTAAGPPPALMIWSAITRSSSPG